MKDLLLQAIGLLPWFIMIEWQLHAMFKRQERLFKALDEATEKMQRQSNVIPFKLKEK